MKTISARKVIIALRNKIVRNNVAVAIDFDSQSKVIMISGKDANRNIHKIEHDLARVSESYAISFDKAYFDDVCEVWVIGYQEKQMKTVSKFHIGMVRASALSALNALANGNHKAAIVKATKLIELASRLGIEDLKEVLPVNVVKCIKNFISKLISAIDLNHRLCKPLVYLFGHFVVINRYDLQKIEVLKSLVILPKLPALR